ncbi:alpha-glucoside transport system substrate-binding protein [Streptomyces sp. SLBN-118]|uniref:extracellular solute-binding protein n=1 Tax=Streptomyces sp. SLBN-118 TaxID=2768454 RepID=UPI0011521788|nr:extracellular solute-binding protein [Streptomyces sp. SLBN-118]TQK45297.1 alpha-glucoside transport system substrate-binding protein [Streptomyces sp. SLBN-118]
MTRLRTLLACLLLTAAAVTAGGCSDVAEERTLVVLGPWTDGEERPFVEALRRIGERTGRSYVYKGTRSLRETLLAQLQADAPPDLAILSSPGDLAEYARTGDAYPLPEKVAGAAVPPWAPAVTVRNERGEARTHAYWAPVRVDLKSLVWSRWASAGKKVDWCLGMGSGATSGWPGTDWVEDLLLQRQGPAQYESWATGKTSWQLTRPAWEEWGRLLAENNKDDGRALGAEGLRSSFDFDHGRYGLLNGGGRCTHEHQGSFIRRHYGDDVLPEPTARFLGARSAGKSVYEVSGDLAAVFKPGAAAWDLLGRLTSREAREDWAEAAKPGERPYFPGGTFGSVPLSGSTRAVQDLLDGAGEICLDASDAMPPTLRDAFYRAVLEFLGAPRSGALLTRLLEQLEAERLLQLKEDAFVLDDLCDNAPW